jgi:hypothetical protein
MITNRVGAPGWPRGFQTAPAVLSRVDANERRTKMRMFNVLPRLIKNTVKNLTHFTCNSPFFCSFFRCGFPPQIEQFKQVFFDRVIP